MSTYFFKMLFTMLVCLSYAQGSIPAFNSQSHFSNVKCIENERQALLNFKHGIIDDHGMLSTWRDDDNSTDCCSWDGIQCNNQTGHILMLDLHGQYPQILRGAMNITSLIHLQNIQHLNLSNNDFRGRIPYELGNLSKLEYLDLSDNNLDGEIPYQLGNLSHLRYLDLHTTYLNGTIPSQLGKLTSLRYLDLRCNHLHGEIPYQLGNLSQLRYLDLGMNSLNGIIPSQLGNLTSLRHLGLGGNSVLKINNAKWLSSFTSLTTLELSFLHEDGSSRHWLQFISEIIPNLRELWLNDCNLSDDDISHSNLSTSLSDLDLSQNMMKSSAIFNWISNFTNLHSLYLDDNLLECFIPDGFGKAMNSLECLNVENNNLQGEIPTSLGNISTLQELYLSNNNLSGEMFSFIQNSSCSNRMTGMLPNLSTFTSLRDLDLSNNQLTGEIPRGIGLLYELENLYLQGNHLEGHINELHLTNLSKLEVLDLSDNSLLSLKFRPTWVPPFQLSELGLASCKLGPSFPSWLQSQSHLSFLDISDAGIDDFVPEWFWNKLQSVGEMNMSYNSLKGTIPNLPLTDGNFYIIILNSNQFEGGIPAFFSQVATLDLSKNKISDLNAFLCRKRATVNLHTLDLSNNQIMGQLPDCWEHLTSLEFLDLRNNYLSGQIPHSMGALVALKALVLRNNRLTGNLPFQLKNCAELHILDVSENLLSGPIPSWIGESLQQLKILSLRVNGFFGSIPVYLCYLSQIQVLDLSRNNLAGRIPTCLRNFSAMTERSVYAGEIVRTRKMSSVVYYSDMYNSNVLLMWKGQEQVFLIPHIYIFLKSIDLSRNDLWGEIPKEVGCLLGLVSLNLARNSLNGEIPPEIGNLNQLDFLDLSTNHLSGRIPSTLSKIDGLGCLNLTNNDLSGRIPWEGHLQDFDASSFEGNIGLCGQQLNKSCPGDDTGAQPQARSVHGEDDNSIFFGALYMSLGLGFFIGFWGLLGPILLWKPWRNAYGRFLNKLIDNVFVKVQVKKAKFREWLRG